ncbi:hypothetical protein P8452_38307 [Trifolium repens]|nr:hypothetical protein P8452_38307 [Trifolium repens]
MVLAVIQESHPRTNSFEVHACMCVLNLNSKLLGAKELKSRRGHTESELSFVFQVDRLTGARTRRELMIGAELGSSD